MKSGQIKFCPRCGDDDVAIRQMTPNHVIELYCPHCGGIAILLWQDQDLVGTAAVHDPDSDTESW